MREFKIILFNDNLWDETISTFVDCDIYYTREYLKAFKINGDGEPILIYYKELELRAIYVAMKRDVSIIPFFKTKIPSDTYYDIISPYGYGGFIFDGILSKENLLKFKKSLFLFMIENNIISDFTRYHPLLKNADSMKDCSLIIDLGKTISLDLSSSEVIWNNITSKNRNMIRKAEKNNILIKNSNNIEIMDSFISIYEKTMDKDNAEKYYYFKKEFYSSIIHDLRNNFTIFYAEYNNVIIAASIILFYKDKLHYHLSGSLNEYRGLAPSNLLLFKVAMWGSEQGFKCFHLGGGVGSQEDNLYKFKASFNRNSNNQFSIGKTIYNNELYNKLVEFRKLDKSFDSSSSFFPLYRN